MLPSHMHYKALCSVSDPVVVHYLLFSVVKNTMLLQAFSTILLAVNTLCLAFESSSPDKTVMV